MTTQPKISVQDIDHLGIIAGIIDEMGLVEQINELLGRHPKEVVSAGHVVKAMILNGLGFVSAPLYLFEQFFVGKATEHLIGEGVQPEHLNDDRLGRVLDQLYLAGLSQVFIRVALQAARRFGVKTRSVHLDSSSFHLHGEYTNTGSELTKAQAATEQPLAEQDWEAEPKPIHITYGYSRDHRPDLKQFVLDLICTADGDVPLFLRVADGNEVDKAVFAKLMKEFQQQWTFEKVQVLVADSALYSKDNLVLLGNLPWISRVPETVAEAKQLLQGVSAREFVASSLEGYRVAMRHRDYGGVEQRWLIVESDTRKQSEIKQLYKRLDKQQQQLEKELQKLCRLEFSCEPDARQAAERFACQLKYHCLQELQVIEQAHHAQAGRPSKQAKPSRISYCVQATLVRNQTAIEVALAKAGRFILATNVTDIQKLSNDEVLQEYKAQQSTERGFRFLKDPMFFTSSIFVKSPERVAAIALVMGLCLLVYNLGQRALRSCLDQTGQSLKNQLGKATQRPTLRWVFQCFQSVHLLQTAGVRQVSNLTDERRRILSFFSPACGHYYLLG